MADDARKQRADAQLRKLRRAEDGRKALSEYEAEAAAFRARTAKLRELRLARDAEERAAAAAAPPPAKRRARTARRPSATAPSHTAERAPGNRNG